MNRAVLLVLLCTISVGAISRPSVASAAEEKTRLNLVFCCAADNDLYRVLTAGGARYARHDKPADAVRAAAQGSGVLILADGYPKTTTSIEPAVFEEAARKKLKLYVEYPAALPGMKLGEPQTTRWERAVVASDAFGPELKRLRILAIQGCRFLPVEAGKGDKSNLPRSGPEGASHKLDLSPFPTHLVVARVAGFDTAVYGLADTKTFPILFEHPRGDLLVATTKLSQFVTARYAPQDAWPAVWRMILGRLQPGAAVPKLEWTPTVRPTFARQDKLPADARLQAVRRGVKWYEQARLLLHESWKDEIRRQQEKDPRVNEGMTAPGPKDDWPLGDGRLGILEGQSSSIYADGSQPVRWLLRADCNSESAMGLAMHALVDGDARTGRLAANLLDYVYFHSDLQQGPRGDPKSPSYGLLGWYSGPRGNVVYYGDDNAKAMLGTMAAAAALKTDRWDEPLLRCILGNLRTAGSLGFRSGALHDSNLQREGWEHFARRRFVNPWPHYESWLWACYLWLYDKTKYEPALDRARTGITLSMQAYPERWNWTNGQQQIERARMLLPLAWLVRVEDKPQHRAWLKRIADDLLAHQDASGALQERLASALKSNAQYGTCETSLLQQNGDTVSDMLYVSNFAIVSLAEAAAATGDPELARATDRLADFLVRIQTRSEAHPELDGAWYRGFDFRRWEYWASNGDSGWGAWCTETGWTQGWIVAGLALRHQKTTLWDLTAGTKIAAHFEKYRKQMLPDGLPEPTGPAARTKHAALGKPVTVTTKIDSRYPGLGPASLTDGELGGDDHQMPQWLGFFGDDLEATIDLGRATEVHQLGANFVQSVGVGIFLPGEVAFSVSDDGRTFRPAATVRHDVSPKERGPLVRMLGKAGLDLRARYVRVRAKNLGVTPDWHPARGVKAWLFVDEIVVNP